jgi:acyl-CoA thioesterase FadM
VTQWFETYRGVVNPWECDIVQHLTIAYYFEFFAAATRNLFDLLGEGADACLLASPARRHATFERELRAGAGFHILTSVTGMDADALRLGHQVVDSVTGKTLTWLAERRAPSQACTSAVRERLADLAVAWPGPQTPDPPPPRAAHGRPTARDRVKPWEIGEDGAMSQPAQVHRFSAANMQMLAAVGMTADYMHQQRRGFSTFALDLIQVGDATVGEMIAVTTLISHLGNSSLRLVHRMTGRDGREIASLVQSGVHLDMDARRSAAIPEALRPAIEALVNP